MNQTMFRNALQKRAEKPGILALLARFSSRQTPNPRVIAEITNGTLRFLAFRRGKTLEVDLLETIKLTPAIYENGIVQDKSAFSALVRHGLKRIGSGPFGAFGVLPEEKIYSRIIQKKTGEVHSLEQLVSHAFPTALDEAVVAHKEVVPLSRQITHRDFNVWAVERNYFASYREALEAGGLLPVDFIPESVAIVSAMFPQGESYDASLVIVPRETKTVMLIFAGRAVHVSEALFALSHISAAPLLARDFVDAVSRAISFYKERVLHEHGASSEVNRVMVVGTMDPALEDRLSFNTQLKIEHPSILSQFVFKNSAVQNEIEKNPAEYLSLLGGALWAGM